MGLGGGILGAIIGGILGGPWGAAIGGGIGYIIGGTGASPSAAGDARQRSELALALLFRSLGKLAKADGRVSREEANFVSQLMRSMQLPAEIRSKMREEFNRGRDSAEDFIVFVRQLNMELTGSGTPLRVKYDIVNIYCALAAVDRVISPAEKRMLQEAGMVLNTADAVEAFFRHTSSSSGGSNSRTRAGGDGEYTLEESFRILGVPETAPADEVKKAWRKKVREIHPDRMQGRGMSAEIIDRAKEEIQKINKAYETIRKLKGW